MALQFVNSPDSDYSGGIDARSSENQIPAGFLKDLLNGDIVERRARKRKGYQGYAGNVPVRVNSVEYKLTEQQVCFTLDSAISIDTAVNLDNITSSPLVVYGRSSVFTTGQGPFTVDGDTGRYYPSFVIPIKKTLVAPGGTLSISGTEHGLGTANLFISLAQSTNVGNRSFNAIFPNQIRIDQTSFDIEIDYTVSEDTEVFLYFANKNTETGSSYVATLSHGGTGSEVFSIPAGTHGLSNYNIVSQIYLSTGGESVRIVEDAFSVDTTGDVEITINSGTAGTYYALLSAAPISNTTSGVVNALSTGTISFPVTSQKPWGFFNIYLENGGGIQELVYSNSISYDDVTSEVTLEFVNNNTTARSFTVFYEYGDIRANTLCVSDTVTVDGTDSVPQLTIWGLDHSEIYVSQKQSREGWVNHIDSYRRSGEQRLICGLGGNLFSARNFQEIDPSYKYSQLYPNLFTRTSGNSILGPVFWNSGETPGLTRGYITAEDSGTHWALVTSVSYDTNNGWTRYTISLPNKQILDSAGSPTSLSSVISTNDLLTVQGMSYALHSGNFPIMQTQDGTEEIYVWVENTSNSSDWDDSNTGGQAGVFTDSIVWSSTSPYIPGDQLISDALEASSVHIVILSDGSTTVLDSLSGVLEIPAGVIFNGLRTSSVVPMRTSVPTKEASVENLVRGDMLSFSGIFRLLRVLYINPDSERNVNITVTSGVATCTLLSGTTQYLAEGRSILLLDAGAHTGTHQITTILSSTEFQFETTESATVLGGSLAGKTVEVDEQLSWSDTQGDTNVFTVEQRWIPLEAPDDSFDLTPNTHVRYFDNDSYSDQSFIRSTMVVDNMYLTNNKDEVYKLDGSNIYRAGIIPWQPGLFLTKETTGATIVVDLRSLAYSAIVAGEGKLTITAANQQTLAVGTSVRLTGSTQTYTVTGYTDNGTTYYVLLDRSLDSGVAASGTISEICTYRYYFRMNAVDVNDNIISSAVTGYQDYVVELTENTAIQLKMAGFPVWDVYDYDRLEVQIYRTKRDTTGPFYLVTTIPISFDNTDGYIDYRDSFADSDLTQLDIVSSALKGEELGINWSGPLRAKYVTSIANKLVLGNVRDFPEFDIQIASDATLSNSDLDGNTLLFRRDNTSTATVTDMSNVVTYEWVNGPTGDVSSFTIGTDDVSFDTSINTGASTGDWIYLTYGTVATTGRQLDYSGWYQIASVSGATVTINKVGAVFAASYPDKYVIATDPTNVPVLLGTDGNLGMVNGDSFDTFDSMRRMSLAINSTMRNVDISLSGYEQFTPWLVARGGNDLARAGKLQVRQPRADSTTPELVATYSAYDVFVNDRKIASGQQVSVTNKLFNSRILVSYENYPEIFDAGTAILDSDSDSAIDINSADGQEITGIIPFFGEAAFGAAQQSATLVVFKTNSIYLVDLNEKTEGRNPVQRIETEGLGCTAPYSIAVTKNGIMFANESGIYCLRRNQAIQYIGKSMERNWTEKVSLPNLDIAQGHHYGIGRVYKLSVPLASTVSSSTGYVENSEVYVYNHTAEDENKIGSWGRYDNHAATGWANLNSNAFFGSTGGRVLSLRTESTTDAFRDDSEAINFVIDLRPNDFSNAGIRKVVDRIVAHYRTGSINTGTSVSYSIDLEEEYQDTNPVTIPRGTTGTGIDDSISQAIVSITHMVARRKCVYISVRIQNNTIDENIELAGVDIAVAGLNPKGILQAAQT